MCYCYIIDHTVSVLLRQKLVAFYNAAVYILVQSKDDYSLIWKPKILTIDTDKSKWSKN